MAKWVTWILVAVIVITASISARFVLVRQLLSRLAAVTADLLSARLASTTVQTRRLDDVSHYPPLEAPAEVAAATVEFLEPLLKR